MKYPIEICPVCKNINTIEDPRNPEKAFVFAWLIYTQCKYCQEVILKSQVLTFKNKYEYQLYKLKE